MTEVALPPDVDAVVFDLGGVLIDWNPRHLYRQLFDDAAAMERFLAEVCSPAWNARQDAGRPWDEAVAELAARYPEQAALIAAFRDRWDEMLGGEIAGSVALLAELRGHGVPVYALTNWSQQTFPVAQARYPFLGWFGGIVVSGEEGLIKPDAAIYARMLQRFGLDPARTAFIDDAPANVAAAAALGLRALQFRDPERLRADLRGLRLPV